MHVSVKNQTVMETPGRHSNQSAVNPHKQHCKVVSQYEDTQHKDSLSMRTKTLGIIHCTLTAWHSWVDTKSI